MPQADPQNLNNLVDQTRSATLRNIEANRAARIPALTAGPLNPRPRARTGTIANAATDYDFPRYEPEIPSIEMVASSAPLRRRGQTR